MGGIPLGAGSSQYHTGCTRGSKPVFINKPLAAHLTDVIAIFKAAKEFNVPVFSSFSTRYMKHVQDIRHGKIGNVMGADTYGPAGDMESTHTPLYYMGIHGVEALFAVMTTG